MTSTLLKCSTCCESKAAEAFKPDPRLRRGRASRCFDCVLRGEREARQAAYAADPDGHFTTCAVCGGRFKILTNTHLQRHGLTTTDYTLQFGSPAPERRAALLREKWGHLPWGQVPDSVIAEKAGLSRRGACTIREAMGIPAFVGLILTQEGVPTRSIYEAKYDAWLHWKGLDHQHEVPVPGLPYIADFQVGRIFVEIAGMADYERYAAKLAVKQEDYERFDIPVTWLTPEMVDRMFQECPVPLKFRDRRCTACGTGTYDLVRGMCRPCHRKKWGQVNADEAHCGQCGQTFSRNGGSPNQLFCSHDCYAKSLELAWPSWEEIDARLETVSVAALARELGVKPVSLYMRLRRRHQRDASAPVVRDSRRKLMAEDVLEIRRRHAGGESQASLKRAFGVHPVTIHQIVHRVTWKEV